METVQQKCRRKRKQNPEKYAGHLQRERARDSKRRAAMKMKMESDEDFKKLERKKSKERMQATRKRRKEKDIEKASSSYKSCRTLGKAVAKVKRNLPTSPTKAEAVVKKIAAEFQIAVPSEIVSANAMPWKLTTELKQQISDFYNRDDISRQMPGMKDVKSFKSNVGTKEKMQKRTMIMSISEAYEIFKTLYAETSICMSLFYKERPAYILPVSHTPHNVCVCITHSNFIALLEIISKNSDFPQSHREFLNKISCNTNNEDCMSNNCEECKESNIWDIAQDSNPIVRWKTWIYQQKRPKQIMVSKPLDEAINELHDNTDKFKLHFFVKNVQSDYFQTEKQNLTDEKAIVQIDFAENYGLISQDEIQSAHWCHGQVTLFTCCIWMKDKLHSVIIISDELKHSKYAVHLFLQKILQYIKSINENITSIYIFSDNCAAQFKNRYVIGSMNALKLEYGVKHLEWNFFAASHGKGAVDGLGGSIKRQVWTAVRSRQALVNSSQDFFDVAN